MTGHFETGLGVMTVGVSEEINRNITFSKEVMKSLKRYLNKDWGELCQEDKDLNEIALEENDRLLGAYDTSQGKLYIITEHDRSVTTVLFASEY